ncbi:RNAse P Rpr2/Rpp21/SNM1 subunit domain-containing protein [Limtongia smithiae]|uniref:RNAse P Rpr2/Rpp21/SNM1 subunit domain-containing protein n=1 Tax=Limtongia smithiae TaxID=1125753 RepID=UPI0034D0002E
MPPKQIKNRDQYLRASFLYQAAHLMGGVDGGGAGGECGEASALPLSRFYVSQMRAVARKSVIRLDPEIKRTMCKRCDTVLTAGVTCAAVVENLSHRRLAHADVLVHKCMACGLAKRYPVGRNREYVPHSGRAVVTAAGQAHGKQNQTHKSQTRTQKQEKQKQTHDQTERRDKDVQEQQQEQPTIQQPQRLAKR